MGYAPTLALESLFTQTKMSPSDIGIIELNEAFASQAVAVIRDAGLDPALVNPYGGAIALGHPVGATERTSRCASPRTWSAATSSSASSRCVSAAARRWRSVPEGLTCPTWSATPSHEGVAYIRLNRPEVSNALDVDAAGPSPRPSNGPPPDDEVRAVLLTGEGPRFCAGGDVAVLRSGRRPALLHPPSWRPSFDAGFQRLAALNMPVVAAVHGAVAGAGLALMLSCDLIVADPATKFVFAYPAIGFTPDCGLSYLLPRSIGQQRALRFALMGEPASAEDAYTWGMVTEVSADALGRGTELAIALASGSAKALGQSRRLIRSGWGYGPRRR